MTDYVVQNTNSGGFEQVQFGGIASSTTVNSGGIEVLGFFSGSADIAGGSAVSTLVSNGGAVFVHVSAVTLSTTLLSGATETLFSGGTASGTTTLAGGTEIIS